MLVALALAEATAAAALTPLGAAAVNWLVRRTGRYAVANEDLVRFALSPVGIATLIVAATVTLSIAALGRAAALLAANSARHGRRASGVRSFARALGRAGPILELSLRQVGRAMLIAAPFAAVVGIIAWVTLMNVDPYYLVMERPKRFWLGLAAAAPVVTLGTWSVGRRVLGWSIALPLCVLCERSPRNALSESEASLRGRIASVALARLAWLGLISALSLVALLLVRSGAEAALEREWGGLTVTAMIAGIALLAHASAAFVLSLFAVLGDVATIYAAWCRIVGEVEAPEVQPNEGPSAARSRKHGRIVRLCALAIGVVAAGTMAAGLIASVPRPIDIEITAHRGASRVAPENTLSAIRAAIELGADRVELDAMLTADGAVVLFHDTDLRRIARDPRRVADMTLAELREVDVGAWFDPAFAGERMPTLDEAIAAAGGRVKLNIELKAAADETRLAEETASSLRRHADGAARGAIVTSLSARAVAAMRQADPTVRVGLIVTASVGNVRRMDADLLAIQSNLATRRFLDRSKRSGLAVHVWGVSDPDLFTRLALQGVEGVIASDPVPLLARRRELQELTEVERLLLAFRVKLLER